MHDEESIIGLIIDILDGLGDVVSFKIFFLILAVAGLSLLFWEVSKEPSWRDPVKVEIKESNQIVTNFDLEFEQDFASEAGDLGVE